MQDRRDEDGTGEGAGNADRLRADIDSGRTRDKVVGSDPAASPLGTDAEAGGAAPTAREVDTARAQEVGRGGPQPGRDPTQEGGRAGLSATLWIAIVAALAVLLLLLFAFAG